MLTIDPIDWLVECNGYASLSSFLPECMFVRLPAIRLLVIKPKEERGNCSFPQNTALHTHMRCLALRTFQVFKFSRNYSTRLNIFNRIDIDKM